MVFDPGQRSFTQFPGAGVHRLFIRDTVQPFPRETFGKIPRLKVQWLHPGSPALLTKQPGMVRVIKGRLRSKGRVTNNATAEACQPPTQPHRPEAEITQRHPPVATTLDVTPCQE